MDNIFEYKPSIKLSWDGRGGGGGAGVFGCCGAWWW